LTVILDYGMGNLRSVEKAVQHLGFSCSVQPHLKGADRLIIPGVGAFGAAMERLLPMRDEIRDYANSGRPLLGICLGQQLLFDRSEELGDHDGLGLIPGVVKYLPGSLGIKVPHIGWSALDITQEDGLATGLHRGEQVYFVHSLYTECANKSDVAAITTYGIEFPAAVQSGNIWGTQFHPEKSGPVGLRILQNFLQC
jgi:imidazole glycerol-phosphate synthase subunit HisH